MECNGGMDYWSGALDWTGLLECHAHKLVAHLGMRIILHHSKDCTKCMSQGS